MGQRGFLVSNWNQVGFVHRVSKPVSAITSNINFKSEPTAPSHEYLKMLRSPRTGQALHADDEYLVSTDGSERYRISNSGIPQFAVEFLSEAARAQQSHYDGMVAKYDVELVC